MSDHEATAAAAAGAFLFVALGFACGCCVVWLGIQAFICWLIQGAQSRVPQPHRQMSPAGVWLLMIPFFNLVWAFLVGTRVPDSIRAARQARGDTVDDCGRGVGLAWAIGCASAAVFGLMSCVPQSSRSSVASWMRSNSRPR